MLFKNGIDLNAKLLAFINSSQALQIYVPYIKVDILSQLLEFHNNIQCVITRWESLDFITGASDLEIYPFLKERGITLYRNPRLHLKAFIDCHERAFIGSANISQRALNFPETSNYNYELSVVVENLSFADRLYFDTIEAGSTLITDEVYEQLKQQIAQKRLEFPRNLDFKIELNTPDKSFLISSLPMSYDVETLINVYEQGGSDNDVELNCALHDLAMYSIPLDLERTQLPSQLKISFFNHPFIRAFLENLDTEGEIYFGRAKDWIQKNCSDVPTPRKWEITTNIQILYRWVVYLGDGVYNVDRPNYSERLFMQLDPKDH